MKTNGFFFRYNRQIQERGRIVIGREEQLAALIDSYGHLVFSICYRMTADYFASEDLTQETFLAAYKHLSGFDGQNAKAWVCRIATNKCLDWLQSAGRRSIPVADIGAEDAGVAGGEGRGDPGAGMLSGDVVTRQTPESILLEKEVRRTLLKRCLSLKPPYDEIAKAYYYDELSAEEIAGKRGMKKKTVQTQIYRARGMLRRMYEKEKGA
ncbi:MAG: sigma-70 family RNA polymerase sigma factor [Bacteroidales bacterium]|nr:sigma-70 family RNA polymerase sigma factor [Bacteroidales bacterium]MCM1414670.1 sigma-70 family RNA polymerase sigma factor [bacterium]MCM1424884.1 sigma-70 family RNA polymerase sigma factor [bacterium]